MKKVTLDALRRCPKAELHYHMDGALRVSTILDLAQRDSVRLPTTDVQALTKLVRVGRECKSLVEYLRAYEITLSVLQTRDALARCAFEAFELCHEDGITYAEARFSPVLHLQRGLSLEDVMQSVEVGRQRAERELGIRAAFIVCAMRDHSAAEAEELARLATRHRGGVVGFDIAGPEKGFNALVFREAYRIADAGGLGLTAHAGEADDWTSVRDVVEGLGVARVGHGVTMERGPGMVATAVARRLCVEACLTSNLLTKAVASLDAHPIKRYLDSGVHATLCTDGVTQTDTTLSREYLLAHEQCGLTAAQLVQCIENGFRHAFLAPAERDAMAAAAVVTATKLLL